jgi:hypothetical protein
MWKTKRSIVSVTFHFPFDQDLIAHYPKDAEVVKAFQNALALLNDQLQI